MISFGVRFLLVFGDVDMILKRVESRFRWARKGLKRRDDIGRGRGMGGLPGLPIPFLIMTNHISIVSFRIQFRFRSDISDFITITNTIIADHMCEGEKRASQVRMNEDEGEGEDVEKRRGKGTYAGIPAITSSPFIKLCSNSSLTFKKIFIVALASSTYSSVNHSSGGCGGKV